MTFNHLFFLQYRYAYMQQHVLLLLLPESCITEQYACYRIMFTVLLSFNTKVAWLDFKDTAFSITVIILVKPTKKLQKNPLRIHL